MTSMPLSAVRVFVRNLPEAVALDAPEDEQALVGRFTGISFGVEDIASAYARMHANGVVFTGEPEKQFWGGMIATLRDTAGNEIQIVENRR